MRYSIAVCAVLIVVAFASSVPNHAAPTVPFDACVAQDDAGTASLPVPACRLASRANSPTVVSLSTGDGLEARFNVDSFFDIAYSIDPGSGDETATFGALMTMTLAGQGGLLGYERTLTIPLQMETLHAARNVGDPTQSFPTEMVSMQGEIFGDPDFDLFRVTAGSAVGLPSPGQTTLTRLPRGDFNVDSFFDVTYRIEFQGAPGGALAGEASNQTYQIEVRVNRIDMAIAAPNPGGSADVPADLPMAPPPGESLLVTAGLPNDSSFRVRPRTSSVALVSTGTGSLGGPSYQTLADVEVLIVGEGGLSGLQRTIVVPHGFDVHVHAFDPAADVQDFDTEMVQLQGEIFGDPDFDLLRLTAGSAFGLPSPGHTTLTRLPNGNFNVDSFFDIAYEIEFVGAPGGALDGASGVQSGTLRLEQGGELPRLRLHTHGPEVQPLGGVRLDELPAPDGSGVHLRVGNIGSQGKDKVRGIAVDLGDGEPLGFEMLLDMGPAGGMQAGSSCGLDLVTRGATGEDCDDECLTVRLEAELGGSISLSIDPSQSTAGSSRVVRLRDTGASVQLRSLSPGDGALLATGALGTTPDGPMRVRIETGNYGTGGGGGGGRVIVRLKSSTPTPIQLEGGAAPAIGTEVQVSLDGLPPGEPVTGLRLRCSGMPDVTVEGLEIISPAAARFDPDPDNNCTAPPRRPRLTTSTAPGGGGTPLPYFALSEIGPEEGGFMFASDHDRDGANDRALVTGMLFTAGDELRLPADARLRLSAASDVCGPGTACSLGLEMERPGSGDAVGRLALAGFAPRTVTLVARSGGTDVDTVDLPTPLPPQLFSGELRGLLGDPMEFGIAVNLDDLFCGCDIACECVAMHLIAPQPAQVALTGSAIGPVSADELELRVALEPVPSGVPIEMISMSLSGSQLCEAAIYGTRFDPLVPDRDGDGVVGHRDGGDDCDDTDSSYWAPPGEVRDVRVEPTLLHWSPPAVAGGLPELLLYDTIVSSNASDFSAGTCIESNDGDDTEAQFLQLPGVGDVVYSLTRAGNGCPVDGTPGSGGGAGGTVWIRTLPVCQ